MPWRKYFPAILTTRVHTLAVLAVMEKLLLSEESE